MSGKFFNSFFKGEDTPRIDNIDMQPQIDKLVAQIEQMTGRIGRLELRIKDLESQVARQNQRHEKEEALDTVHAQAMNSQEESVKQFYLSAPTSDGVFSSVSEKELVGKSIYVLSTCDGQNGTFSMLATHDALATAKISVSQFVKTVCKVHGNINTIPKRVVTEEEGVAVNTDGEWRMMKKAVVRFE
ncbi:hypothetical protein JHU38_10690 [Prevotella sp. A2931]|uniref:Uncharacterized protein n=1 Tax=Prevotella illustrans TaxID=2800387 RepID=A0ABS3M7Y8_9BACT|nr:MULTISPECIES: hypothetical protein [Prevotella]MBO1364225.1 hypothetical protein [Prevotella illustrans]PTL25375.1 hypothetical protein C3V39_12035 [Prevotella sp. oral taxon 820]